MNKFLSLTSKFIYDMITIGVYLGFALNNYAENRQLQTHVSNLDKLINLEILENQANINYAYDYHLQLKKDIQELKKSKNLKKALNEFSFKGLHPGVIEQSAFETGIQTGVIQEMDIDKVVHINKLYTLQKRYNTFNEAMVHSMLSRDFPDTNSEINHFLTSIIMNMNDELSFEEDLKVMYKKMLEKFEYKKKAEPKDDSAAK